MPDMAATFVRFADEECRGRSGLYERLARGVAMSPELHGLAAEAGSGQPVPNLFFAAVHDLLLNGADGALRGFYPSVGGGNPGDPMPALRAFCDMHRERIAQRLRTRRVQTNEVRRSTCLLPGFELVARRAGGRPLAIVEVGAAAGLNLRFDRYHYDYGPAGSWGGPAAAVALTCDTRGTRPPLPRGPIDVAWRLGIDVDPIDVRDPAAAGWLRALVWPDQPERAERLARAIADAAADPPSLLSGDALDLLPRALADAPADAVVCVVHTYVLNQFSAEGRRRFAELTAGVPFVLSIGGGAEKKVRLNDEVLAGCDPHGGWLEWRAK